MTMTAVPLRRSYRLEVGDLGSTAVRVVRAPHLSLLTCLVDVATGPPRPGSRAAALASVLSPDARRALPALGMPGLDRLPGTLAALGSGVATSVAEHASRLADTDGSSLTDELCLLWAGQPPGPWRSVADRPRAWLRAVSRAFLDAWTVGEVHHRAAELLLRREEARIGAAAVTGTLDTVLGVLNPRLHAGDGFLDFDAECDQTVRLGDRTLALVPMLVPGPRMIVDFAAPGYACVAYSLPGTGAGSAPLRPQPAVADRLAALLGPVRAAVLRALDHPITMHVLARTVHCSPSTLTYHCDQLVAAGLLRRERHGRSVLVYGTERARGLVDLLS